jgi:hypothetical protein
LRARHKVPHPHKIIIKVILLHFLTSKCLVRDEKIKYSELKGSKHFLFTYILIEHTNFIIMYYILLWLHMELILTVLLTFK